MSVIAAFIVPHPPIILPEVGRGKEKEIQKTIDAFKEVAYRIAALKPDTIVLTSPHTTMYADYFHISPGETARGDLGRFGAPAAKIEAAYDSEFVHALAGAAEQVGLSAGTQGERDNTLDHATIVPLRFINEQYNDYKLVRIGLSGLPELDHYRLGKCIAQTAEDLNRRVVFVASGDLSHKLTDDGPYGFDEAGPAFDRDITTAMAQADFLHFLSFDESFSEAAAECGLRSFIIMAGALDGQAVDSDFLSYEGTFGVGYGVCAYRVTGDDASRHFDTIYENKQAEQIEAAKSGEDAYVRLARLSLEIYLKTGKRVQLPDGLPAEMLNRRAGAFVTLKKHGQLRGCIGTIGPMTDSIAEEILRNAVSAGTEDPRFPTVTKSELKDLVYSVDVLAPAEPIQSIDELDVKRYGVIVSKGYKRGLLLPNLDGVNTPQEQVSIAMQKGGIQPNEDYTLERFEVVRHK